MNDISDSFKQISYALEPIGSCDVSSASLFNAHVCHATALWRHRKPQGGHQGPLCLFEVAPGLHPSDTYEICI